MCASFCNCLCVCVCVCVCVFFGLFVCVFICLRDFVYVCMLTFRVLLDLAHDMRQRIAGGESGVMCRVLSLVAASYS